MWIIWKQENISRNFSILSLIVFMFRISFNFFVSFIKCTSDIYRMIGFLFLFWVPMRKVVKENQIRLTLILFAAFLHNESSQRRKENHKMTWTHFAWKFPTQTATKTCISVIPCLIFDGLSEICVHITCCILYRSWQNKTCMQTGGKHKYYHGNDCTWILLIYRSNIQKGNFQFLCLCVKKIKFQFLLHNGRTKTRNNQCKSRNDVRKVIFYIWPK